MPNHPFESIHSSKIAVDLCIHHLLLASAIFCNIQKRKTPNAVIDRLYELASSPYDLLPAKIWIEQITALYEAGEADNA